MAAPAPSTRRRSPGASPRPRPGSTALPSRSRWLIAAGVGVLLLAAYLLWARRAQGGGIDTSGAPGPDHAGSAAQQPSGGASDVPGNLPPELVSQPDPVTTQVQTTDASASSTAPYLTTPQFRSYQQQYAQQQQQHAGYQTTVVNTLASSTPFTPAPPDPRLRAGVKPTVDPHLRGGF